MLGGTLGVAGAAVGATVGGTVGATVGVAGAVVGVVAKTVLTLTADVTDSVNSFTKIILGGSIGNKHFDKVIANQAHLLAIIKICAEFKSLADFKYELALTILFKLLASLEFHFGEKICFELAKELDKIQEYIECLIANIDKKDYKAIASCTKNLKKYLIRFFSIFAIFCGCVDIENLSDEARVIIGAGISILLVIVGGVSVVVHTVLFAVFAKLNLDVSAAADLQVAIKVVGKAVSISKGAFEVFGLGVVGLNDELKGIISFVAGTVVILKNSAIIDALLRVRMSIVVALNACLEGFAVSIIDKALFVFDFEGEFLLNNQRVNKL